MKAVRQRNFSDKSTVFFVLITRALKISYLLNNKLSIHDIVFPGKVGYILHYCLSPKSPAHARIQGFLGEREFTYISQLSLLGIFFWANLADVVNTVRQGEMLGKRVGGGGVQGERMGYCSLVTGDYACLQEIIRMEYVTDYRFTRKWRGCVVEMGLKREMQPFDGK